MVPFVGRAKELEALRGLFTRARREGAPGAALITGEPGSGKSRLLREAISTVGPDRSVRLAGFEPTRPVPLAAAGDLLRRLAAVPVHGRRLEALVFGSDDLRGQGALPAFEAAHRALAAFGPLVVTIDDLQWVDEQSLGLLIYLLRAAESTRQPIVMIAAARPSPAAVEFAEVIAGCLPESRRTPIELRGLSSEAGIELAQAIDDLLDNRTAAEMWRRAAGSPFWLDALARGHASAEGSQLVTDRLRTLSSDAADLLNMLAVGGRPFGRGHLVELAGWRDARLDQAVHELTFRGLVVEEFGAVRLAHDLIREAAAETVPAPTRQALHRRLAGLLEQWAGADLQLLTEAVDHRAAAGLPAGELATRILRSPQRRLIPVDGLRRFASIADDLHTGSSDQRLLDEEIGKLASVVGDQELALRHWLRLSEHDVTPRGRQRAASEAALAAFRLGRAAAAHEHLDRARDAAASTPETLARTEALHAEVALWLEQDAPGGAAAAHRALAAAREMVADAGGLDSVSAVARQTYVAALEAAIGAAMQEERFDDIRQLSKDILPAARGLDDEAYVAALLRSGFGLRPLGAVQEAEAQYREAWEISQQAVLPFLMIEAGIGLSSVLRDVGQLSEARDVALETLGLEARLGSPPGRWGNALATLHTVLLSIGEPAGLAGLRSDAIAYLNPHFRIAIHQLIAVWQARVGGPRFADEVEAELSAGRSDAELAGCPRCRGELVVSSAEALARIGRLDDARRELAAWDARPIGDYPERRMWRARAEASISEAAGDHRAAAELLRWLERDLERRGLLDERVWALLDGGAACAHYDRPAAVEAYTEAADLATRIGAGGRTRIATRALRRLGVRAWRRGPAGRATDALSDLSRREREVAGLVAGGATNIEVAASLAISPKTVERHVTNILAKVGVRNRTELAARLGGPGAVPR